MIQGESNVYLTIAPGGGLAGVHLDQEGAARTQASLIGGVVACVPVIADFRELPVSADTVTERQAAMIAESGADLASLVAANAERRAAGNYGPGQPRPRADVEATPDADMRICCESRIYGVHRQDCASWGHRP